MSQRDSLSRSTSTPRPSLHSSDLKSQPAATGDPSDPTPPRSKCLTKEFLTCVALSSIVIGLPIAIIIVLINLPKLSTRRDTRQQHYILLAFGFPFSLVVIVALVYGVYSLIRRIRQGPDHSKHFRSRMSWRRFSRRLRGFSQRDHHHHRHHHRCSVDNKQCNHHSSCSSLNSSELALGTEPKLYSLVAQVMSAKQRDIESEPHLIFQTSDPLPESNTTVQLSAACLQHHGWRSSPAPI